MGDSLSHLDDLLCDVIVLDKFGFEVLSDHT